MADAAQTFFITAVNLFNKGLKSMVVDYEKKDGEARKLLITIKELTDEEYDLWKEEHEEATN